MDVQAGLGDAGGVGEAEVARRDREQPDWRETLAGAERAALAEASAALRDVADANAAALQRQIELSVDMMDAIAAEAQRLAGTRSETYSAGGRLARAEAAAPISVNTKL